MPGESKWSAHGQANPGLNEDSLSVLVTSGRSMLLLLIIPNKCACFEA